MWVVPVLRLDGVLETSCPEIVPLLLFQSEGVRLHGLRRCSLQVRLSVITFSAWTAICEGQPIARITLVSQ